MTKTVTAEEQPERERIAERWRRLRKEQLLAQKELAALLKMSREQVSRIENAHVRPRQRTLRSFQKLELELKQGEAVK